MFFIKKISIFLGTVIVSVLLANSTISSASVLSILSRTDSKDINNYEHYINNNYNNYKNYYNNFYNISSDFYRELQENYYKIEEEAEPKEITYNPENLREPSNLTLEQIKSALEGCKLEDLAEYYYKMEKEHNINALFLMALNIEESGYGRSYLAQTNLNLGGVKARNGSYAVFSSWQDSLEYIANLIDEMYLTETGPYYNGTSVYSVNVKYSGSNRWATNLNRIAYELLDKAEANNN